MGTYAGSSAKSGQTGKQAALVLGMAVACLTFPVRAEEPVRPANYTETIPGSDVRFEMVAHPRRHVHDGQPAETRRAAARTRGRSTGRDRPFWMGKTEVTWDEYDEFARAASSRTGRTPRARAERTPTPSPGPRRPTPTRPSASAARASRPSASPTTRRWNTAAGSRRRPARSTACRPRPSGSTPAAPGRRPPTPSATTRRSSDDTPGTSRTPTRDPAGRQEEAEPVGPATTCTATSRSGAWTTTPRTPTPSSRRTSPPSARSSCPTAEQYPHVARGGSWDDGADRLPQCRPAGLGPDLEPDGPGRQSIWWHSDADFVGFRVVRALEEQEDLKGLRSQVRKAVR